MPKKDRNKKTARFKRTAVSGVLGDHFVHQSVI